MYTVIDISIALLEHVDSTPLTTCELADRTLWSIWRILDFSKLRLFPLISFGLRTILFRHRTWIAESNHL